MWREGGGAEERKNGLDKGKICDKLRPGLSWKQVSKILQSGGLMGSSRRMII